MGTKSYEVEINPAIIKWARESAGWSVEEIATKLRISEKNYQNLELGQRRPTFRQLELLANYFKRPLATFFLPEPPEEPSIASSFRILPESESELSKDLRLAIRKARYYQAIANELMLELGLEVEPKTKNFTTQENPQRVAQEERRNMEISLEEQFKWKNANEAFNIWRSVIEARNILIFQFKFPVENARGFTLMDKQPPVIVLNSNDNILARIFTLFHEYAHIILGIPEIYTEEVITHKEIENWCNTFASEFLIPEKALKEDEDFMHLRTERIEPEILQNLSKKFKVSRKAILTRLKTLNLIQQENYERESAALEQIPLPQRRVFITPAQKCIQEKGKQFITSILEAKERGIITTQDAIEYLSINLKHLNKVQELVMK